MLDLLAFFATLGVGLLAGFRLGRAHRTAAQTSGRAAPTLPPDQEALLMALTAAAQTIVNTLGALPGAIDTYTARQIADAEAARDAQQRRRPAGHLRRHGRGDRQGGAALARRAGRRPRPGRRRPGRLIHPADRPGLAPGRDAPLISRRAAWPKSSPPRRWPKACG